MKPVCSGNPALADLEPYDPASLPAEVFISANESPYAIPTEVRASITERLGSLAFNRYPDPLANKLRGLIGQWHGVQASQVLCGNGGDELLFDLTLAFGGAGRTVLSFGPTFSVYALNAQLTGSNYEEMPRVGEDFHIDTEAACKRLAKGDVSLVIVTSPNNPTGCATDIETVRALCEASDALVLSDEAYGEFGGQTALPLLAEYENLIILHTFSKAYRAAGSRLGYILANEKVIDEFLKVRQPYSVDSISQIVGEEIVKHRELFDAGIAETRAERSRVMAALSAFEGVAVYPSDANFFMLHIDQADDMRKRLYEEYSILVRSFATNPLALDCLRITVGSPRENDAFISAFGKILEERQHG